MSLEDYLLSPLQKINRYPVQLSVRSIMGGVTCGAGIHYIWCSDVVAGGGGQWLFYSPIDGGCQVTNQESATGNFW